MLFANEDEGRESPPEGKPAGALSLTATVQVHQFYFSLEGLLARLDEPDAGPRTKNSTDD